MGKIIPFKRPDRRPQEPSVEQRLVDLGQQIDAVMFKALQQELSPREVAGILSHRLGTLIAHIEDKSELWPVCERVLRRQALLDE